MIFQERVKGTGDDGTILLDQAVAQHRGIDHIRMTLIWDLTRLSNIKHHSSGFQLDATNKPTLLSE